MASGVAGATYLGSALHPTSAAAGSAPPAGTYYAPPSGAIQGAEDTAAANQAYQQALARFNQQRTGLLTQYGYKGTVDPTTGLMTNVGVDTSNSTGQLQQLLGQQDTEDNNAEYAAEDRGISGGLANQAQTALRQGHAAQTSDLANTMLGSLSDLNDQQLTAQQTENAQLWQAQQEATQSAISGGDYNPTDNLSSLISSLISPGLKTVASAPNSKLNLSAPTAALKSASKAATVAKKVVANAYNTSKTKKG